MKAQCLSIYQDRGKIKPSLLPAGSNLKQCHVRKQKGDYIAEKE